MPLLRRPAAVAALTATAVAALACAPAAHAVAITETTYAVTAEVKLTYGHTSVRTEPDGTGSERVTDAVLTMKTTIDDVLFRDGKLQNPDQWGLGDATTTGSGKRVDRFLDAQNRLQTRTYTCTPEAESVLGRAILSDNPDGLEPLGRGERLTMRLAEGLRLEMPCPGTDPVGLMMSGAEPFGQGPLDTDFDLPAEAIGMGKIIQLVHSTPAQEAAATCPGRDDDTVRCTFSWEGTITFDRTGQETSGGTPPPASPAPPAPPAKPPVSDDDLLAPLVPPADDSDLLAPLVPVKSASLSRKGDRLSFKAACPRGCAGTLTVAGGRAKGAAAGAKRRAASVRFTVEPGKAARTVTVRLPAAMRKAVRAKRAAVRLTLTPKGGRAVVRTLAVRRAR